MSLGIFSLFFLIDKPTSPICDVLMTRYTPFLAVMMSVDAIKDLRQIKKRYRGIFLYPYIFLGTFITYLWTNKRTFSFGICYADERFPLQLNLPYIDVCTDNWHLNLEWMEMENSRSIFV